MPISVMAGNGRLEAAKFLGIDRVPTIRIEDMTEAQKRAYILADNKLAENAGWDRENRPYPAGYHEAG